VEDTSDALLAGVRAGALDLALAGVAERGFAAIGLAPRVAFEAGDPRVLMDLARRGLGVAIVPASAPEGLHVLEIRPRLRSRLELVWRGGAEMSPAARELVRRTREALADR
jgi:DNA-binding transcriptional LysR family regulator